MYVVDLENNYYAVMATYEIDERLNGNYTISSTLYLNKPNALFLDNIAKMWTITDDDGITYRIIYCKKEGEGNELSVQIKGIPMFYDAAKNSRIILRDQEENTVSYTGQRFFELIFDTMKSFGYNYNFVLETTVESKQWEGIGDGEDCLDAFKRGLNRYELEFYFSGNTIYLRDKIGIDSPGVYRHKLNASDIVEESDAEEYYTYAEGYGDYTDEDGWTKAALRSTYISPMNKILGMRVAPLVRNGNVTKQETLDKSTKDIVEDSLKVSISANVIDLRKQGYPVAQSSVGDRTFVIYDRLGLKEEVRIVQKRTVRDWTGDIIDIDLTFGTEGVAKRQQAEMDSSIKDFQDIMDGIKKLPFRVLDNAFIEAVKSIQNAETELIFTEKGGILAVDRDNPNKQVWFNSAGLMISNDGGRTAKVAITGEGIVAERILAGVVKGLILEGGEVRGGVFTTTGQANSIEVKGGEMIIYRRGEIISVVDGTGQRFYRGGTNIGKIATNNLVGFPEKKGLTFDLEHGTHYMSWAHRDRANDENYTIKFGWFNDGIGFRFWDKVEVNGETVLRGKVTGTFGVFTGPLGSESGIYHTTSGGIRLQANENSFISMDGNGVVRFVHRGTTFQQFDP